MKHRTVGLVARAAAGALVAAAAFGACAEQAYLYTYQGNPFTWRFDDYSYKGGGNGPILSPGLAFSIMLPEPLVAGQAIQLSNEDLYPGDEDAWDPGLDTRYNNFSGVMGENGAFQSWSIDSSNGLNINERSVYSALQARDSSECCSTILGQGAYNLNAPGTWTRSVVETSAENAFRLNTIYRVDVTTPLPEIGSTWMALLGVAAVGFVARRRTVAT